MLRLNNEETNKCFRRAFTLIELMIVMVVISIMVGITIPIAKYVTLRARQANQRIYIEKIKSGLEDYRAAYGEYPITPSGIDPATGSSTNYADAVRHYPASYATECSRTTNSPYINVGLSSNIVETITAADTRQVDYCLTYPLMLRQRAEGARPFMDFKYVTVAYLVFDATTRGVDRIPFLRKRRTKSGGIATRTTYGTYGNAINRPMAIDPVSQHQWKYRSEDGVTYSLTTNSF